MLVTFTAAFTPRPGAEAQVETILRRMVAPTRREPGCLAYDLYATDGGFILMEAYVDEAAVAAHRAASYFADYRRDIADLLDAPITLTPWRPVDITLSSQAFMLAGG